VTFGADEDLIAHGETCSCRAHLNRDAACRDFHYRWRDRSEARNLHTAQRSTIEGVMENGNVQPAVRYLKATFVALSLIGGGGAQAASAGRQLAQQVKWCNGDDHATPDTMISGCTALIHSRKYSGRNLAIAFTNRGSAYDDKRDEDQAIADHDSAIRIDPKLDLAFNNRANAYGRKGEIDRALADYDAAIRLNPKFSAAYNNRGTTYRDDKRDTTRAIADYDQAIRINPRFADAYNNRGIAYDNKGDRDRALADYTSAIRYDAKFALAYNNRGLEYREKGEYDAAIADFNTALAIDSGYANAYRNRGHAYVKKGDYDRAITDFTAALAIKPKDSESCAGRGLAYQKIGDYDRAIADYDNMIAIDPQDMAALSNRGYVHFYRGDFVDAAVDLSHVVGNDLFTYPSLFRFLAQSRAGEAASGLEAAARRVNSRDWPYPVFELYLGQRDPAAALSAAQKPEERCEALFYVGEWQLLQGDRALARQRFEEAIGNCPKSFIEYTGAQAELRRLGP
jgi:tetratricopeptide (TPR) repeat protein